MASCTAEYAHPQQRGEGIRIPYHPVVEAFFDWYGLHLSIFQLSNRSWDSEDGFPKDEKALAEAYEALANDKEFTLSAVRQRGFALEFASETLRSDKEVVMEAVRQEGWALEFASETLRSD